MTTTKAKTILSDGDTFEHSGLTFRFQIKPDEGHEAPWDNEDGHGEVSDYTTRDKRPGERVLIADGSRKRYYDFAAAIITAKKDGWDTEPYKTGTAGERAVRAVEADYKRLKAWCDDEWTYIGVVVTLLDTAGEVTRERESLWGIESDSEDYHTEVAHELAEEIAGRVGESSTVCQVVRP